jgi:HPt (histidine-containing phosphotransfer) domain-containing protein
MGPSSNGARGYEYLGRTGGVSKVGGGVGMAEMVVDRQALLDSLDNDAVLLKEVVGIFLSAYPGKLTELRAAVMAGDCQHIAWSAHGLLGSVSTFGAKTAVEAARRLESMGLEENVGGVDEAFAVLERELASVRSALDRIAAEAF